MGWGRKKKTTVPSYSPTNSETEDVDVILFFFVKEGRKEGRKVMRYKVSMSPGVVAPMTPPSPTTVYHHHYKNI